MASACCTSSISSELRYDSPSDSFWNRSGSAVAFRTCSDKKSPSKQTHHHHHHGSEQCSGLADGYTSIIHKKHSNSRGADKAYAAVHTPRLSLNHSKYTLLYAIYISYILLLYMVTRICDSRQQMCHTTGIRTQHRTGHQYQ